MYSACEKLKQENLFEIHNENMSLERQRDAQIAEVIRNIHKKYEFRAQMGSLNSKF